MRIDDLRPELTVLLDAQWAFANQTLVGELYLFDEPLVGDNHIGYEVRPSYRRQGIATALLHHGLDRLRERGIAIARITCRETNAASAAVIERAGATRLEDKRGTHGQVNRRYTITTDRDWTKTPAR